MGDLLALQSGDNGQQVAHRPCQPVETRDDDLIPLATTWERLGELDLVAAPGIGMHYLPDAPAGITPVIKSIYELGIVPEFFAKEPAAAE